ncbi:hypothetical protein FN960_10310 [Alkalicoccobacillus porphyridii]|uniref:LysM peptidoglycan-binding domain-containing protein n=2 Tax=Alkalicoccobacillus porphyridii TaxID=2597270 RepID=A0A553ZZH8_9BACI|nr:hypothetical protein FN960_10310 [Alkalicoccobacillus porphyridii]
MTGVISDLRTGSLPDKDQTKVQANIKSGQQKQSSETIQEPTLDLQSQEVIVEPGHTVLSIVEHLHQGPIPVSIQQIVDDFKALNHSLEPDAIQIGQTYLFPIYDKE